MRDYLIAELANCFSRGTFADMGRAASYLHYCGPGTTLAAKVYHLLVRDVTNEKRWVEIATASMNATAFPHQRVADLRKGQDPESPEAALAAMALSRIPVKGLDEKIITCEIDHRLPNPMAGAATLDEYANHPTTIALLTKLLMSGDTAAITLSEFLTRNPDTADKNLRKEAIDAAERFIARRNGDPESIAVACQLIIGYGSERQVRALLCEFERCRTQDRARFLAIWNVVSHPKHKYSLDFLRIGIRDGKPTAQGADIRVCDFAVYMLERVTNQSFDAAPDGGLEQRNAALEKARDWLKRH